MPSLRRRFTLLEEGAAAGVADVVAVWEPETEMVTFTVSWAEERPWCQHKWVIQRTPNIPVWTREITLGQISTVREIIKLTFRWWRWIAKWMAIILLTMLTPESCTTVLHYHHERRIANKSTQRVYLYLWKRLPTPPLLSLSLSPPSPSLSLPPPPPLSLIVFIQRIFLKKMPGFYLSANW